MNKILIKILSGSSDKNINFNDVCNLLKKLGFSLKIKGDHYIFTRDKVEEIINIQPLKAKAKAYQVRQIRNIILKYKLGIKNE